MVVLPLSLSLSLSLSVISLVSSNEENRVMIPSRSFAGANLVRGTAAHQPRVINESRVNILRRLELLRLTLVLLR